MLTLPGCGHPGHLNDVPGFSQHRPAPWWPGVYLTDATIESDNRVGVDLWGLPAITRSNLLRPELSSEVCSAGWDKSVSGL
jgi:hypothetical protein